MRRSVAVAIIVGLALVAGLAALADMRREAAVSPPEAVAQATTLVRDGFRAGDAVRVEPPWDASPWWGLRGAGPGADRFPYPAFFVNDGLDPVDLLGFERLWVIGLHHREPALPAVIAGAGELEARDEVGDGASVARYRLAHTPHLRTMTGDFARLVTQRRNPEGAITACPLHAARHRCGFESWLDLHVQERDVYHLDVAWLFAHPGPDRSALEVTWPELPGDTWAVIRVGHTLEAVRREPGADVHVTIFVDGQPRDRVVLPPHAYRLERRALRLPAREAAYSVTVTVQTDDPGWREVMLEGTLLADLPDPIRRISVVLDATDE